MLAPLSMPPVPGVDITLNAWLLHSNACNCCDSGACAWGFPMTRYCSHRHKIPWTANSSLPGKRLWHACVGRKRGGNLPGLRVVHHSAFCFRCGLLDPWKIWLVTGKMIDHWLSSEFSKCMKITTYSYTADNYTLQRAWGKKQSVNENTESSMNLVSKLMINMLAAHGSNENMSKYYKPTANIVKPQNTTMNIIITSWNKITFISIHHTGGFLGLVLGISADFNGMNFVGNEPTTRPRRPLCSRNILLFEHIEDVSLYIILIALYQASQCLSS